MRIETARYGGRCACGREHTMETRLCVIEEGALKHFDALAEEAGASGRRCCVYDRHTYHAQGLCRPKAEQEIVLDPEGLHADERSTAEVLRQLSPDVEVLVAVGGGTIHDIARYCAGERGVPFIAVPTAASCDGFCSTVAAMTWEGFKKTLPRRAPVAVVADLDVISKAPAYLTASGVGDLLGKYIALADWEIAHLVTGEFLCRNIYGIMKDALESVRRSGPAAMEGDPEGCRTLAYGLLMSGVAMQMMGNSRPASGAEHHISHLIEMEPEGLGVRNTALHGEKVGVGAILAAEEYHRLARIEDIAPRLTPCRPIDQEALRRFFGERLYPGVRAENETDCLAAVTPEAVQNAWGDIRRIVSGIPQGRELDALLGGHGGKHTLADLGVPEEERQALLEMSPLVRGRLTFMRMRRMIR